MIFTDLATPTLFFANQFYLVIPASGCWGRNGQNPEKRFSETDANKRLSCHPSYWCRGSGQISLTVSIDLKMSLIKRGGRCHAWMRMFCALLTLASYSRILHTRQIKLFLPVHRLQGCRVCLNQAFKLTVRNKKSASSLITHANNQRCYRDQ